MEEGNYFANNLPFSDKAMIMNLDKFKKRVDLKKLASVIIIDGGLGLGKTTTAVQIASYIEGEPIDFTMQLALGGTELSEKLLLCQEAKKKVLIYDEASDFNRRGALTKFNAELNRVFDICRAFKIIIIIVLPSVKVLDNDLFHKGIVRGLFHVADKGINFNLVWAYSTYRLLYLVNDLKNTKNNPVPGKVYLKHKHNFDFRCQNLTSKRAIELEGFSTSSKLRVLKEVVYKQAGLRTTKEIGESLGISARLVQMRIKDLGVKPILKKGRKIYYDSDIIEKIRPLIVRNPR